MPPPSSRLAALVLILTTTLAGCGSLTPAGRGAVLASGVALAVGGYALKDSLLDSPEDPGDETYLGEAACFMGGCLLAVAAMVVGGVVVLGGLGADSEEEPPAALAITVVPDGRAPSASGAHAPFTPAQLRPLPEVATDAQTLRMAQQVRSAALRGDCASVATTLASIAARDPRYHAALVQGPAVTGCR